MAFMGRGITDALRRSVSRITKKVKEGSGGSGFVGRKDNMSGMAGKTIEAKKGGMIKKKATKDMVGRAMKRTTADAKGRAMKMKKGGSAKKGC